MRKFFYHGPKEQRLLCFGKESEVPKPQLEQGNFGGLEGAETQLEDPEQVKAEMDRRVHQTYEMLHFNWQHQINMLTKQIEDWRALERLEGNTAEGYRKSIVGNVVRQQRLGNRFVGRVSQFIMAGGNAEMLEQRALQAQMNYRTMIDDNVRKIHVLRYSEPTLADAAQVAFGNPAPEASPTQYVSTQASPQACTTQTGIPPETTPFEKSQEVLKDAFSEFAREIGFENVVPLMEKVLGKLGENPGMGNALKRYAELLESEEVVGAEDKGMIVDLQMTLGLSEAEKEIFEKFLRQYSPLLRAQSFEDGEKKVPYPLKEEVEPLKSEILQLAELYRESKGMPQLQERILASLQMKGVDMDRSVVDGENHEAEIFMLPQDSAERFIAYFLGLVRWVNSWGLEVGERMVRSESEKEKNPADMNAKELEDKIAKNKKELEKIPEEKGKLTTELEDKEKKLADLKNIPDQSPDNKTMIDKLMVEIEQRKKAIKDLDARVEEIEAEQETLTKLLNEKKKQKRRKENPRQKNRKR